MKQWVYNLIFAAAIFTLFISELQQNKMIELIDAEYKMAQKADESWFKAMRSEMNTYTNIFNFLISKTDETWEEYIELANRVEKLEGGKSPKGKSE